MSATGNEQSNLDSNHFDRWRKTHLCDLQDNYSLHSVSQESYQEILEALNHGSKRDDLTEHSWAKHYKHYQIIDETGSSRLLLYVKEKSYSQLNSSLQRVLPWRDREYDRCLSLDQMNQYDTFDLCNLMLSIEKLKLCLPQDPMKYYRDLPRNFLQQRWVLKDKFCPHSQH